MYGYNLKWNQINGLFEYTPRFKRLSIYIKSDEKDDYKHSPLPTLIDLDIRTYDTSEASKMISLL